MTVFKRIGILASGAGSNLPPLFDLCSRSDFSAKIVCLMANCPGIGALERAAAAGIPTEVIPHRDYADRPEFEQALDQALRRAEVDLVCFAGFKRILTADFVLAWQGRMLNIHPSLLPSFKGLDTHQQALLAGVRVHGCTVHFVTPGLDDGPIIVQAAVPVLPEDDVHSLAMRVMRAEHLAYPLALRMVVEGRARLDGEQVRFAGTTEASAAILMSPEA